MNLSARARTAPLAALLALAAVLVGVTLLRLGASGLWEPDERAVAQAAVDGEARLAPGAGLRAALAAVGLRLFGSSELAVRLPGALLALLTAALVLLAGRALYGWWAGCWAAWLLVCMPAFVLGARQLTAEMPLLCALGASTAGLGGAVASAAGPGRRLIPWLGLAASGMALGTLAGGWLLGALVPALAFCLAIALGGDQALPASAHPASPALRHLTRVLGAGALLALLLALMWPYRAGALSWRLGGVLIPSPPPTSFDLGIAAFGFGVFPLAPVAFFALLRPLAEDDSPAPGAPFTAGFGDRFLLLLAALALAVGTLRAQLTGEASLAFLPAAALATGRFVERRRQARTGLPLLALLLLGGVLMLARDLGQTPAALVSAYLPAARATALLWPPALDLRLPLLASGLVAGLCLGLLALPAP